MYKTFCIVKYLDKLPKDMEDGKAYDVEACLLDPTDRCKLKYKIQVRLCGSGLHYYLLPTDDISAYCFSM